METKRNPSDDTDMNSVDEYIDTSSKSVKSKSGIVDNDYIYVDEDVSF